jgi:hypothetical protein
MCVPYFQADSRMASEADLVLLAPLSWLRIHWFSRWQHSPHHLRLCISCPAIQSLPLLLRMITQLKLVLHCIRLSCISSCKLDCYYKTINIFVMPITWDEKADAKVRHSISSLAFPSMKMLTPSACVGLTRPGWISVWLIWWKYQLLIAIIKTQHKIDYQAIADYMGEGKPHFAVKCLLWLGADFTITHPTRAPSTPPMWSLLLIMQF